MLPGKRYGAAHLGVTFALAIALAILPLAVNSFYGLGRAVVQAVPAPTPGTPGGWGIFAAGIGIGFGAAISGVAWAVRTFRGVGPERAYRSSSVEAMDQVTAAIRDLSQTSQRESAAVTTALQSTALALTKITERLDHIPTKLDLAEEGAAIRHDAQGAIGGVSRALQEQIVDLRTAVSEVPLDTANAIYNRERPR